MGATVVTMGGRSSRPLVTLVDSPAAISLVQRELLAAKRTYKDIAQAAGVASSTVSNIAIGHTRWPRLETLIRILSALGWQIVAQRTSRPAGMG